MTWKNTIDFGKTFVFLRHWISTNFPKFQSKFQKFHKISKFSKFLNFPKYKKKIQKNFTKFQNYNFFFLFLLIKFKLIFNFFPVLQKIIRQLHPFNFGQYVRYMLSGCELIDTENISLPSQNMKFGGEWAKLTSHKLHILSRWYFSVSIIWTFRWHAYHS